MVIPFSIADKIYTALVSFGLLIVIEWSAAIIYLRFLAHLRAKEKERHRRESVSKYVVGNKKREPLIAVALSLATPGLGQIYNGQIKKGIIFYLAVSTLFVLLPFGFRYNFAGFIFSILIAACLFLYVLGDSLSVAIKSKEIILKPYNKWYFYLLFFILNIAIYSMVSSDIVKSNVSGSKAYKISSGAMVPTLLIGDHIIIDLKHYKNNIAKKGDIIVFKYPEDPSRDFIMRIIATEDDILESRDKTIYVNGIALNEPYIQHIDKQIIPKSNNLRDNFGHLTVPKDKVFVMGDNRDQSYDSRYWGYVDKNQIRGKALYIYWAKNKNRIGIQIK